MAIGKVAAHLCLTLLIEELKINVELDRVVINNTKYNQTLNTIFSVSNIYQGLAKYISANYGWFFTPPQAQTTSLHKVTHS